MFTNKNNNAKMAWDYGRDPVCKGRSGIPFYGLIYTVTGKSFLQSDLFQPISATVKYRKSQFYATNHKSH